MTEIKEIEEFARISYADRQIDEVLEGKEATIAGVISDLKEEGYTIKQESGNSSVIGIALSEENVKVERNTNKTVTYTLVYSEETIVRYFVEVQGQYHEINFNNGNITISIEEATLGETNKEPEVTIESSDSSIIEVAKTEEGKLLLSAKDKIGDVEITVKEVNSSTTKKFTATTRIPVTSISILPWEKTIKVGETANLSATIEPSSAIDKTVLWNSSDTNIAMVSDSGVVTAIAGGTAIITASSKDGSNIISNACTITVKEPTMLDKVKANPSWFYGQKVRGYEANGISDWRIFYADENNVFIITTDYVPNSKVPTSACGLSVNGNYSVFWQEAPLAADTRSVAKFAPVTPETVKWTGDYRIYEGGRCASTLLDYYKWDSFVNNKYAEVAIGSPTLNMWVASWNKKYPEEKIYCNNTNQLGYYVGISDKPTSESVNVSSMAGYQVSEANNMYFPHKRGVNVNTCQGYWLASTSAYNRMRINIVGYNGDVTYDNDDDGDLGVRCVVCLKSEVCITENADWSVTLK